MHYAEQKKIKINSDVWFVSYANLPMVHYLKYQPVASVEQFPNIQGQKATQMLLELLANKEVEPVSDPAHYKIIVDSKLVIYNE